MRSRRLLLPALLAFVATVRFLTPAFADTDFFGLPATPKPATPKAMIPPAAPKPTAPGTPAPAPQNIETLRNEFQQKRAAAAKPVVEWYRQQLTERALSGTAQNDAKMSAMIQSELKALDQFTLSNGDEKPPTELVTLRAEFIRRIDAALLPVFAAYRQQLEKTAREAASHGQADLALACRVESADLPANGASCAGLAILKASYGAGDKRMDAKKFLISHIVNQRIHITGGWGFPDVAPFSVKSLEVTYRFLGEVHTKQVSEGGVLALP